jgi:hypothetical protein
MAIKLATDLRDALVGVFETNIGTSPILNLYTGSPPAAISDADSGTLLASIALPSDWLTAPNSGTVSKNGTWQDLAANNTGNAGYFRIKTSGSVVKMQGTVSASGGGGDMIVNDIALVTGLPFSISTFTITAPGA